MRSRVSARQKIYHALIFGFHLLGEKQMASMWNERYLNAGYELHSLTERQVGIVYYFALADE